MSNLVAVFQIGSLGDSLVSLPTLLSIRELIPDCSEYLLVSRFDSNLKVLPSDIFDMAWKPSLKVQYSSPEQRVAQVLSLASTLAKLRYYGPKYCVSLMASEREPERIARDIQFFKAAGIKNLIGFHSLPYIDIEHDVTLGLDRTESYMKFHRAWGDMAAQKFPRYCHVPLITPDAGATARVAQWLTTNRRFPNKRLIAISPYSNWPSKDIPDEIVLSVIQQLTQSVNAEIVMVGGKKDFERCNEILKSSSGLNASGIFSVQESTALLKACSLSICADSGPMHLSAAVGVPLLAIYSRIGKRFGQWLPFGQQSTILFRDVACAGCVSVNCQVAGHPCMKGIPARQIVAAAMSILNGQPVDESMLGDTKVLTWSLAPSVTTQK